jgi:hypothetical protein
MSVPVKARLGSAYAVGDASNAATITAIVFLVDGPLNS